MQMGTRAVVWGGTFDPIQEGHVNAIRYLLERFALVVIAVTSQNPFKGRQPTPIALRREMIRRVLDAEGIPVTENPRATGVFVSDFEYTRSREFVENWWNTVDKDLSWAVGADLGAEVPSWSSGSIIQNIVIVDVPIEIPIHATDVRQGRVPPHPAIRELIASSGLYT